MNKSIRKIAISLMTVLLSLTLVACTEKAASDFTPQQVVSLYMEAITKQDYTAWNAYTDEDLSRETFVATIMKGLANDTTLTLTATQQELLAESLLTGLGTTRYTIVSEDITDDTAVVLLDIYGVNMDIIMEDLKADLAFFVTEDTAITDAELYNKLIERFAVKLAAPHIIETPVRISVPLNYTNDIWVITSEATLSEILFKGLLHTILF